MRNKGKRDVLKCWKYRPVFLPVFLFIGIFVVVDVSVAQTNPGSIQDSEGNSYRTLQYGDQIWTIDNWRSARFADCTDLVLASSDSDWLAAGASNIPAYCYPTGDDKIHKDCGYLYNYAAIDPANPKRVIPAGWRVPTKADWDNLQTHLISKGYNLSGATSTIANGTLGKAMARVDHSTRKWATNTTAGNVGCTGGAYVLKENVSQFSAIPCGWRRGSNGAFQDSGRSYFHSTIVAVTTKVNCIKPDATTFTTDDFAVADGYPIRLVRDVSAPLMNVQTKKCADCP